MPAHKMPVGKVFRRDKFCCVYCDSNLMESFDAFATLNWDHLKPTSKGGSRIDLHNLVTACSACNTLKGAYDPTDGTAFVADNREEYIAKARARIVGKRTGIIDSTLYNDYQYWIKTLKKENP